MGEAKRKKQQKQIAHEHSPVGRGLIKLDDRIAITDKIANTPLGRAILWLIYGVEILSPEPMEPRYQALFDKFQSELSVELMWVFKERTKAWARTDYPFNTDGYRALESAGLESLQLLNLFEECKEFDPDFPCPLQAWVAAKEEKNVCDLKRIFSQGTNKGTDIKSNRDFISKLKAWKNPYSSELNPSIPQKDCRIRYLLFEDAIAIGKPLPGESKAERDNRQPFIDKAWTPYINALSRLHKNIRYGVRGCSFRSLEIKGDSVIVKLGGRKQETWFSPPKTNISGRGRKANKNLNNPCTASDTALLNPNSISQNELKSRC